MTEPNLIVREAEKG
ncbi:TPA: hypothetical protein OB665_002656 [Escherichia coli]|nr:hypothetical protein [Escherichia coli]HCO7663988.1 hypothetical protein [Escherichia coli]HEA8986557.1 hypothetical protein [Escherichia coli]